MNLDRIIGLSMNPPEHLNPQDIEILLALWNDLYEPRDWSSRANRRGGLTREELSQRLVGPNEDQPFKTDAALFKHLAALKQLDNLIATDTAPAQSRKDAPHRVGKRRDLYTLAAGQ